MTNLLSYFNTIPLHVLIILSALGLIFGDLFAKLWTKNQELHYFLLALLCYLIYGIFFIPTLLKEQLVISALAVIILNIIGFLIIGILIFGERLTPIQIVGLLFGIISVVLLEQ